MKLKSRIQKLDEEEEINETAIVDLQDELNDIRGLFNLHPHIIID